MKNSFKGKITKFVFLALSVFTLTSVNAQLSVNQYSVDYTDDNTATLVGADGLIMKTIDGGQTWEQQTSGTNSTLYGNDQLDVNLGITVGENGTILVTLDGGQTWSPKTSGTTEILRDVQVINSTVMVACGDNGMIVKSDDGGETWTSITSGTLSHLNDVQFIDENNGFSVGDSASFLVSTDQGNTWTVINTGLGNVKFNAVCMLNALEGTVVGETGLIVATMDGGLSWTTNSGQSFTDDFNDVKFINGTGVAVGNHGLIAKVDAGSITWYGTYGNVDAALYSVNFANSLGICVGEEGLQIVTFDEGINWYIGSPLASSSQLFAELINAGNHARDIKNNPESLNPGLTPEQFSLNQNYPNPFNPSTKINYNLPVDAKVTLQIFDMTGRQVRSLVNGLQAAGNYTVEVDAKGMSSGVYFYRISADAGNQQFAKTMKMILTK